MGILLVLVGFAVNLVCGVIILIKAFKVSVGWGLAVFFIPFAGLFFVINHWNDTKNLFLGGLAGAMMVFLGAIMLGNDASERATQQQNAAMAEAPRTVQASVAPTPVSYQPPRSTYTPSYNPPPAPPPKPVVPDKKTVDDEWSRKPMLEQVYASRETKEFYSEKCRKRPENVYRIPKSVALMQGMTEAKCR